MFWYISDGKVRQSVEERSTALQRFGHRLSGKATLGVDFPPLQAGLEADIAPSPDPHLVAAIEQLKRTLGKHQDIPAAEEVQLGNPPELFRYRGRSAKLVNDGVFWTATVCGGAGIVLVGSASNAYGVQPVKAPEIGASADPLGTIRRMYEERGKDTGNESMISYIWAVIVGNSIRLIDFESLPQTTGVAIYGGMQRSATDQIEGSGYKGAIDRIIVGSPIFVEQISA